MMSLAPSTRKHPPLPTVLPPLLLGSATFNHQYNTSPHTLATSAIIHCALSSGITGFDTSPYYGPAEALLGTAFSTSSVPRESYFITTKCGRIAPDVFDYSTAWIRGSVARSLERLHTDYLDLVLCHDVEFVTPREVLGAVCTLRELRDRDGVVRYIGISGFPVDTLVLLAQMVKEETGEPLDAVMSYANYTLQNTSLWTKAMEKLAEAGVDVVMNASPLGMGLLRSQGVPVGDMGDFHPAPRALREKCAVASQVVAEVAGGMRFESLALRFALEGWSRDGAVAGTEVKPVVEGQEVAVGGRMGVTVGGVSFMTELEELLEMWRDIVKGLEREELYRKVQEVFGEEWTDYAWASPGEGYVRGQAASKSRL